MHEILFKAKRLDNGEWVKGHCWRDIFDQSFIMTVLKHERNAEVYNHKIDPNTLCQFTGLTDRDGNKIWENDIVDVSDCWWTPNDITRHLVEWNETLSGFSPYVDYDSDCDIYYCSENSKATGNKFDNFELLERNFK